MVTEQCGGGIPVIIITRADIVCHCMQGGPQASQQSRGGGVVVSFWPNGGPKCPVGPAWRAACAFVSSRCSCAGVAVCGVAPGGVAAPPLNTDYRVSVLSGLADPLGNKQSVSWGWLVHALAQARPSAYIVLHASAAGGPAAGFTANTCSGRWVACSTGRLPHAPASLPRGSMGAAVGGWLLRR
jgi:hypothetical protein